MTDCLQDVRQIVQIRLAVEKTHLPMSVDQIRRYNRLHQHPPQQHRLASRGSVDATFFGCAPDCICL